MHSITKDFHFSAAHSLPYLPEGHKCRRVHGHNYIVRIEASGPLDANAFVMDYAELNRVGDWIDGTLDHRNLNEVLGTDRTTAEFLAAMIFTTWKKDIPLLTAVSVSETPKVWARYSEAAKADPWHREQAMKRKIAAREKPEGMK